MPGTKRKSIFTRNTLKKETNINCNIYIYNLITKSLDRKGQSFLKDSSFEVGSWQTFSVKGQVVNISGFIVKAHQWLPGVRGMGLNECKGVRGNYFKIIKMFYIMI